MYTHQNISLILQSFTAFILASGAIVAYFQLRALNKSHKFNIKWNQRIAAQNALSRYHDIEISKDLLKNFDYVNNHEPIPIEDIENKIAENPSVQIDLHKILNFYESIARGIDQEIYDDEIIRLARKSVMIRSTKIFKEYIDKRRAEKSPNAWIELEKITRKWAKNDWKRSCL